MVSRQQPHSVYWTSGQTRAFSTCGTPTDVYDSCCDDTGEPDDQSGTEKVLATAGQFIVDMETLKVNEENRQMFQTHGRLTV
ncbi:hypothetical protein AHF37_02708 [Paragonimus kellicotti]|nr:hypothetical protein AHF37_02708 [Paragonimus kellicotti]